MLAEEYFPNTQIRFASEEKTKQNQTKQEKTTVLFGFVLFFVVLYQTRSVFDMFSEHSRIYFITTREVPSE